MAALAIRLRAQLRVRRWNWLAIALLTGVLGGLVIAAVAGAKRTQGSYSRYLESINQADVYVDPFVSEAGDTIPLDDVARLPQVAATERTRQLLVLVRSRSNRPLFPVGPNSLGWLLPTDERPRDAIDSLKLLHGRLPDPRRPNEVIGDTKALSILGVHVGDTVGIRTIRQHALDNEVLHLIWDPRTHRLGPYVRLRVVGVAANARADVDGGQMHLTPAFLHAYGGPKIGSLIEELEVQLRHGQADLPAFKRGLARVAGKNPFLLFEPNAGHPKIQHSIDLEARALWLIAALFGVAALVIAGQALLRSVRDEASEDPALRALGAGTGHQLEYALARSVLIAVPAGTAAAGVAYLVSALMPIGWARELDPRTGLEFDAGVLVPGALAIALIVVVMGQIAALRGLMAGAARRAPVPAESRVSSRLTRRHGSPAFAAGVRMAFGADDRGGARATVVAATLAVAVCVMALTFAASFHHLTNTPRLYGQTWDYETFSGPAIPKEQRRAILRNPGVLDVGAGADSTVTVNGVDTGVRAWDDLKGTIAPAITQGRRPRGTGEIALAAKTLDDAHAQIGDRVRVASGGHVRRLRVVGRTVLPSSKTNKLGHGGVLTFAALHPIDRNAQPGLFLIRLAGGPAGERAQRRLDFYFDANIVVRPDEVGDFGRIDNMPLYIALLAVGAAGAALAHALVTRVRRGRRELAVLKTLGFTRGQVAAAIAWQATTILTIAVVLGLPLGAAAGRFIWHLFARDLGVVPDVVVPLAPVLLLAPATVVAGNLLAAIPGWFGARIRPAPVLRTE